MKFLAELVDPLVALTRKGVTFMWGANCRIRGLLSPVCENFGRIGGPVGGSHAERSYVYVGRQLSDSWVIIAGL